MCKVACIGAGYWGKNLVRNFHQLGALDTICDLDETALAGFREAYPDVRLTPSFGDVLKDASIPAVVIAAPAEQHYRLTRQALLAGKHVFVEKPLALRADEGRDLVSLAERQSRILMVGHILEYHPAVIRLKEIIDSGELGRINYIYSSRLNLGKVRAEENILWSFAPHDISVILLLLGEMPAEVTAVGQSWLRRDVADVTVSTFSFASGAAAHIFVSWLHPFKEQRLVVVGDRRMAVFDDVKKEGKLELHDKRIDWVRRLPVPRREQVTTVELPPAEEPLKNECLHFLECVRHMQPPRTDGRSGLRVLEILQACQESLGRNGTPVTLSKEGQAAPYFVHETATVDRPRTVGQNTRIWHYCHVSAGASIGEGCTLGQNVFVAPKVKIGNRVKIQNNVSVYAGVALDDGVFVGPSVVFTNVLNPRGEIDRKDEFRPTVVGRGATIGANATIVCGHNIGRFAFIGAGAVVTHDVPDFALVVGNPARIVGYMCRCGTRLEFSRNRGRCQACGERYFKQGQAVGLLAEAA
ncbi:MAG: Gfo/Idh/MocA family oxidoreductase [Pseudomonadota bacterium]